MPQAFADRSPRALSPWSLPRRPRAAERADLDDWWRRLVLADRRALNRSWEIDAGHDADGRAGWVGLDFVPALRRDAEADARDADDAARDFHEYVDNHPELVHHVPVRTFHICRAHPAARDVVRRGHLPADFACPLQHASCPMRALLARAPGCEARLDLRRMEILAAA